jgi:cytochrome c
MRRRATGIVGQACCVRPGLTALLLGLSGASPAPAAVDVQRGAAEARQCMACHSFAPGRHMTGPSLAALWGRYAGTAMGFGRYSGAMKGSSVVWNAETLDAWLRNPAALVPGNSMAFCGVPDAAVRADLLAYLQAVSDGRVKAPDNAPPDLKRAPTSSTVNSIRYCGDAYRVATADGSTRVWWEFNLRFKTDGSANGPAAGKPVLVGNGMQGDRAAVVFSRPDEISAFLRKECP